VEGRSEPWQRRKASGEPRAVDKFSGVAAAWKSLVAHGWLIVGVGLHKDASCCQSPVGAFGALSVLQCSNPL